MDCGTGKGVMGMTAIGYGISFGVGKMLCKQVMMVARSYEYTKNRILYFKLLYFMAI